jgi:valyl-tRNA synthetase
VSKETKAYDPSDIEPKWYQHWLEEGCFHADAAAPKRPFSIAFPPPNITGSLHIGHALTVTIQDILIRWKRMTGFNALWLPGTDHAGIATQVVVERELKEREGKTRHELGREQFLERVWAWKERHGSRIAEQLKVLGASFDWRRERFTMEPDLCRAVREAFVRLWEEGLIHRARRLINWCPRCRTALSDLEVENAEQESELFHFAYPLEGGGEVVVATTRPETMLGDTAVAVHPDDPRHRALIGRTVRHPFVARDIPVIGDAILVDPEFGTGALKVTPGHDWNDFDAGERSGLSMVNILELDGRLNAEAGPFRGLDRFAARQRVKDELLALGLARGTQAHTASVPHCQRCDTVVEPMLSLQWFVRTGPLRGPAVEAVERGETRFVPESWSRAYLSWMANLKDWCISRQLWWGHRIPAWYCAEGHITVGRADPDRCGVCGATEILQDEDVLDTWFSSALWPFSTLGWPEDRRELRTFYPTSVMETGYDILYFWVARMMMMGLRLTGKVPFRTVVLHSMIVDEEGEKMSKVRGNVIDPLDVTRKHGADALRLALAWMSTPAAQGRPIKMSARAIEDARHFANKIWNVARFAQMNLEGFDHDRFADALEEGRAAGTLGLPERWILSRLQATVAEVEHALSEFRVNEAAQAIQRFVWHEVCDWYVEIAKPALYGGTGDGSTDVRRRLLAQGTLFSALESSMRLLHPFMPFVTEEVWQRLPKPASLSGSIVVALYPTADESLLDPRAEADMDLLQRLTTEVRNLRAMSNVPPGKRVAAAVVCPPALERLVAAHAALLCDLGKLGELRLERTRPTGAAMVAGGFAEVEVFLNLLGVVDLAAERARLTRELEKRRADLAGVERKLEKADFLARAPAAVVKKERERARAAREEVERLERNLLGLGR